MTLIRDRDLFDLTEGEHGLHDLTGGVLTAVALAPMLRRSRAMRERTQKQRRIFAGAAVVAAFVAGWRWLRRATTRRQAEESFAQTVNGTETRADGPAGAGGHWRLVRRETTRYADYLDSPQEPPPASLAELVAEMGDLRARARALAGDSTASADDRERAESVAHALEHLGALAAGGGIHGATAVLCQAAGVARALKDARRTTVVPITN